MFPIRPIDRLLAEDIEFLGTKRKFWFTLDGVRYLFKAEDRGTGEDWAEKIVCELAHVLGLPHLEYELAHEFEGDTPIRPGVICQRFGAPPQSFEMGNQLLVQSVPNYPFDEHVKYGVKEHTVEAVALVIGELALPERKWMELTPPGISSALDVFVGYLLLDAWVANQDRHHQNWGAIRDGQFLRLGPTYDHGASLARNLSDKEREERLRTKDKNRTVAFFSTRGASAFYATPSGKKTLPALEVFRRFARFAPQGASSWLEQLRILPPQKVEEILHKVPSERMTLITREFTFMLLRINQQRLLETSLHS